MTWTNPIILCGSFIALLLIALLLFRKQKTNAQNHLVIYFSALAAVFITAYISFQYQITALLLLLIYTNVFMSPLLYLYVRSLTDTAPSITPKDAIHALPTVLTYTYLIILLFTLPDSQIIDILNRPLLHAPPGYTITMLIEISVVPLYLILMQRRLNNHKKGLKDTYSCLKGLEYRWLKVFIILELCSWCVVTLLCYLLPIFFPQMIHTYHQVSLSFSALLAIYLGYFGIKTTPFFTENKTAVSPTPAAADTQVKKAYAKSSLKKDKANTKLKELKTYMETEHPYLNPELTIGILSNALNISNHNLSEILNTYLNTTFYDFINKYRIEAFKKKVALQEHKTHTILALAFDSGFNSKTAFNRIFKTHMNQTPSQYIKSLTPSDNKG